MTAEPTWPPIKTDDTYRRRQHAWWTEQANLLREDGNEPLAEKCERFAATWKSEVHVDLL